jgi:hypothetical protein
MAYTLKHEHEVRCVRLLSRPAHSDTTWSRHGVIFTPSAHTGHPGASSYQESAAALTAQGREIMNRPVFLIATAIVTATALAGCGSTAGTAAAGQPSGSAGTPSTAATASSCESQAVSWKNNGGSNGVNAVVADLASVRIAADSLSAAADANGDMSSAESALQSTSASLQSDAQAAEADPPPSCIPGVRLPYLQGLADYAKAAADFEDTVSELTSGADTVALGDVAAGVKAANAANAKIGTASTALGAFDNSQS